MDKLVVVRLIAFAITTHLWLSANGFSTIPELVSNSILERDLPEAGIQIELERSVVSKQTIDYIGRIYLGDPRQSIEVIFDTTFNQIWVPKYRNEWANLHYNRGHNCDESSACKPFNKQTKFHYRGVKMSAFRPSDLLTFKSDKLSHSISIEHQEIWSVFSADNDKFRWRPFQGVVGLGLGGNPTGGMQRMLAKLFPSEPEAWKVALWFNANLNDKHGGQLTIGRLDTSRFEGEINYIKSASNNDWQLGIKAVRFDRLSFRAAKVQIDSASLSIKGPRAQVEQVYWATGSYESGGDSEIREVDCKAIETFPDLEFVLAGADDTIKLRPSDYVRRVREDDERLCYLDITATDGYEHNWVLGTAFLTPYYTVFDYHRRAIGFATSR